MNACGNPKCNSAESIHGSLTFGWGQLDKFGYWEYGCRICARNWDIQIKQTKDVLYKDMLEKGNSHEEAISYLKTEEWLNNPAWPYNDSPHTRREG